jgi:hypothetical protein
VGEVCEWKGGYVAFAIGDAEATGEAEATAGSVLPSPKNLTRQKKSWVDSGSGSLPSE